MQGAARPKGRQACRTAAASTANTATVTDVNWGSPPSAMPLILLTAAAGFLLASLADAAPQSNGCTFPEQWKGKWFLANKQGPVHVNKSHFAERKCLASIHNYKDTFLTVEDNDHDKKVCFRCMIISMRHANVITYKESECDSTNYDDLREYCNLQTDIALMSMYRLGATPISCPFSGAPYSFSYNRGKGECNSPGNQAETCTDDSRVLLKYQACHDVSGTESSTEELQCFATWKDGRDQYMVGTVKSLSSNGHTNNKGEFRCFIYEPKHHNTDTGHPLRVSYEIGQSEEASCSALTSVREAPRIFKFTREDKDHERCKFPSWVMQHHVWHSLDGQTSYRFMGGNSTLKISWSKNNQEMEEKVVCHNLETLHPKDDGKGPKVKLVTHVINGCDTGYVCMIFHKRDGNVIEVQRSKDKAIMPSEACSISDPSTQNFTTLITATTLHKKNCPQPGRYTVVDMPSAHLTRQFSPKQQRRLARGLSLSTPRQEYINKPDCQNTGVRIGCTSGGQNEMAINENCNSNDRVSEYSCHGSWEEKGVFYTIVSRNKSNNEKETLCVSMKLTPVKVTQDLASGVRAEYQELWLSRPRTSCLRRTDDQQWTYRLSNQGVCEDLLREASSSGSGASTMTYTMTLLIGLTALSFYTSR